MVNFGNVCYAIGAFTLLKKLKWFKVAHETKASPIVSMIMDIDHLNDKHFQKSLHQVKSFEPAPCVCFNAKLI